MSREVCLLYGRN